MIQKDIKIVFIIGSGRSGTTLLDRLLGQHSKAFSVGELNFIWRNSFIENQLCGCQKRFHKCKVWNEILSYVNECNSFDIEFLSNLEEKYRSTIKFFLKFWHSSAEEKKIKYLVKSYECIYKSIKKYGNYDIIIDSSKNIPHFYFLSQYGSIIEPYIIHIVRNPKAVAYSWMKKKLKPDKGKLEEMPKYNIVNSSLRWFMKNFLVEYYFSGRNYIRVRYEDLTENPRKTLEYIYDFLNLEKKEINNFMIGENIVKLGINHTVSGNPMRFKTGEIKIEKDDEWREKLNLKQKVLVDLFTFPLTKKYYGNF